jgi:hypothetical protein
MELPSFSPDRPGRRSKRYAIEQLITPHIPRHTHPSELMVISRRKRPKSVIILLRSDWILIRTISRRILGDIHSIREIVRNHTPLDRSILEVLTHQAIASGSTEIKQTRNDAPRGGIWRGWEHIMRITMIGTGYVGLVQAPVSPISATSSPASTRMRERSRRCKDVKAAALDDGYNLHEISGSEVAWWKSIRDGGWLRNGNRCDALCRDAFL